MNDALITELQSTAHNLLATLNSFPAEKFNVVPFEGSWTAGQTAQHTLLAVGDLSKLMRVNTKITERDPEANVKMLRDMFLNFDLKLKAPEAINPPVMDYDKAQLASALEAALTQIKQIAETEDLDVTCMDFEFPTVGELTRAEWINFASVHTIRHTHQLKNIQSKL